MKKSALLIVVVTLAVLAVLAAEARLAFPNQPPMASFTYSPDTPSPDEIITFDASSSYDSDGWIVQYAWNFGDGVSNVATTPTATHSYPIDGNYTVELTVTDNSGAASVAAAVVQVRTVVFFRVTNLGTLTPIGGVQVTAYFYNGSAWVNATVGINGIEIKYDILTQPDLANTPSEKYRNPGYTASILMCSASNIGFDIHPATWKVYFKFVWSNFVAYWPNETTRVYTYKQGAVETYDYAPGHRAYYDPMAGTYVIDVNNIHKDGVAPTESHPIIVGVSCPPPTQRYYMSVRTNPVGIATIPGEGWYNNDTDAVLTAPQFVTISTSTQYRFSYWDVDGTSKGAEVNPITVRMNANHSATAHYVLQYLGTFKQSGLLSDATGIVVTVDGSTKQYGDLPFMKWVDSGSSVSYTYNSIVTSSVTGKQYRLNSITGPSSPITVTAPTNVTGNYVTQYSVTITHAGLDSSSTGTVVTVNGNAKTCTQLPYTGWFDGGSTVTYSYDSLVSSSTTGKRFRLNSMTGPVSPITVSGLTTVTGNYVIQYQLTFAHLGLDSTATGIVLTVNGTPKTHSELPDSLWVDAGSSVTYSYHDPVLSSAAGARFKLAGVTGPMSPITVTGSTAVTGNYGLQYSVTFDQTGVGSDYAGTVLTVDGTNYGVGTLPTSFWWNSGSSHSFSFGSPLVVNAGRQYLWQSTTGLSTLQSGTLAVSGSGSILGNYVVQNGIIFDQTGVGIDFSGVVVIVDGTPYTTSSLPVNFLWQVGTTHTFTFQSPLVVTTNGKRYVWSTTTGLSALQSGSIVVSNAGSVVAHYTTQYYLDLPTNPQGVTTPTGSGWYDDGSFASISTDQYVLGGSRLRFTGWATGDMSEITDPTSPATTVFVDQAKNVTANYVQQYQVTFSQIGVGSDFTGTVVTIDSVNYAVSGLPQSFWWDSGSSHAFAFASSLVVDPSKQYIWTSTSGLSTLQSGTLAVTGSGSVTGNYGVLTKHQITFSQTGVGSDFTGTVVTIDSVNYAVSGLPQSFWWDTGTVHTFAFQSPLTVNGKRYVWTSTTGLSSAQSGSITVSTSGSVTGSYKMQYYLTLATSPPGVASPLGAGWYDAGTNATVSTTAFVDIVSGSSRYRFDGWTTANMSEIGDASRSPTSVLMDEAKTVTANYAVQYYVTFAQNGVGSDFTGTILIVDGKDYNYSTLPFSSWLDSGSIHTFSYGSPLVVDLSKRYSWTHTTGLMTTQSGSLTVSSAGDVTGHYTASVTYTLTITTTAGGSANPAVGAHTYSAGTDVQVQAFPSSGYLFDHWELDGANAGPVNPYAVTMNVDHTLKAYFRAIPRPLSVLINPTSGSMHVGDSLLFTSTPSGGALPYSFQWYLDGSPVPSANSDSWLWTTSERGLHYVYLKVTDGEGHTASSSPAVISVSDGQAVGGYSVSLARQLPVWAFAAYFAVVAFAASAFCLIRRKIK